MQKHRKCVCHYVPPHIIGKLASTSDPEVREKARLSAIQGKVRRVRRTQQISMDTLSATTSSGTAAKRKVYDSQNTWEQRKDLVRDEGGKVTGDESVDTVYDFAGAVRTYFKKLERNSIDNQGMDILLNVHFGVNYMNAFWDGDEMTFGDGDGSIFTDFTKSLDVVAHELVHGVTQHTANLDYYSQSGALNEHFSDVFGSAIQQFDNKQNAGQADWLVGNEIMGPTLFGESLRSMKAPGSAYNNNLLGSDPQPSHMKDYYSGQADNQGVHINSGIPNRVFYLVATDIGTDKATLIWYQALRTLWPEANFNDAVEVISHSSRLLTKVNKVPEGSTQTVRLAFKEVGLPY
jgi:Zn-dependent metalloprotease